MEELFEKLKAEPPVNRCKRADNDSPRRESLPAIKSESTAILVNKSRSMSPISPQSFLDENKEESRVASCNKKKEDSVERPDISPKKVMPTKAQQKLFEPIAAKATVTVSKDLKIKACKVRIKRENLVELRKKFSAEKGRKSTRAAKNQKKPDVPTAKAGVKRKADTGGSPATKKSRESKDTKQKKGKPVTGGFFIKLNSSPPSTKKPVVEKPRSKSLSPTTSRDKPLRKGNARGVSSSPVWTTKATKFTRSQLIKNFGKRYFSSIVRIERCRHPLMKTFECNARAHKTQARNKSKNLSVSFREQVEIIGCSDTESNYSEEPPATAAATVKGDEKPIVTPARLKKIENGKVIEDIEFDPTLFVDPSLENNSSTPMRKKTEKKSYSPLKDDSSSSAKSEQLKLANEKLPPCGLRQLRDTAAADEDEDDEECEYIVPIDLPERRSSQTNSLNNTIDSAASTKGSEVDGTPAINDDTEDDKVENSTSKDNVEPVNNDVNESVSQKISEPSAEISTAEVKRPVEHVNSNGTSKENTDSQHKEDSNSNNKTDKKENESLKVVSEENNSSAVNTCLDEQENKTENTIKSSIDKLSKDDETPKISNSEEKEISTNVNNVTEVKTTAINT